MELHWDVIGAPSSAGAHTPGVEKAPGALRKAGLEVHADPTAAAARARAVAEAAASAFVVHFDVDVLQDGVVNRPIVGDHGEGQANANSAV